ncbi:unnamed protein product [Rangifer tarandus platyrhynchus]|uniref:Uncharacterized protein n=1 Tax=Rangifer tarandus platyrhynchus TaxID=3082113 RepID=A0AC59ZLS8_RANTA
MSRGWTKTCLRPLRRQPPLGVARRQQLPLQRCPQGRWAPRRPGVPNPQVGTRRMELADARPLVSKRMRGRCAYVRRLSRPLPSHRRRRCLSDQSTSQVSLEGKHVEASSSEEGSSWYASSSSSSCDLRAGKVLPASG